MALSVSVGTKDAPTTANPTAYSITGVGFEPVAMLVAWGRGYTDNNVNTENLHAGHGVGFATGASEEFSVSCFSWANNTSSHCTSMDDAVLFQLQDQNGGASAHSELTAFTSDGASLSHIAQGTSGNYAQNLTYLMLAGIEATAGYFDVATSDTEKVITGVGFEPSALILLAVRGMASFTNSGVDSRVDHSYGFVGSSDDGVSCSCSGANGTNNEYGLFVDGAALVGLSTSSQDFRLDHTSYDSDGFTLAVTDAPAATTRVAYLALGGVDAKAGKTTTRTTAGDTDIPLDFTPEAVLFASVGQAANSGSPSAAATSPMFGFSDGTNHRCGASLLGGSTNKNFWGNAAIYAAVGIDDSNFTPAFEANNLALTTVATDSAAREVAYLALAGASGAAAAAATPRIILAGNPTDYDYIQVGAVRG